MYNNELEFDYLGIKAWHEAGYKGQGVTIMSKEAIIKNTLENVECNEPQTSDKYSVHATSVMDYICQVVPEAIKYSVSLRLNGDNIIGEDYIKEHNPDIFTTSFFQSSDTKEKKTKIYKDLYKHGTFLVCSFGNDAEKGHEKLADDENWLSVGSCRYNNGNIKRASYSSIGNELDVMSFDNLYTTQFNVKRHVGTSFAAPLFAGMLALVQCFFIAKTGKKLTNKQLLLFIQDNCMDLEDSGKDSKTGYGLFRLPSIDTIEISKYTDAKEIVEEAKEETKEETIEEVIQEANEQLAMTTTCENCGKLKTIINKLVNLFKIMFC